MKIEPVKNYANPNIPTKKQAPHDLTKKFIPKRWLKNAVVAGAFTSFVAFGCSDTEIQQNPDVITPEAPAQTTKIESSAESTTPIKFYKVAPLFQYGTGYDSFSMYSPMLMTYGKISEEDARRIIIDEAKKNGLDLTTEGELPTIKDIKSLENDRRFIVPGTEKDNKLFVFDGIDKDKRIVFEVVTAGDVMPYKEGAYEITDLKGAATKLREEILTKKGDYTVGVFYDPVSDNDKRKSSFAITETLLRTQVQEFIKWLKDNKLID